MIDLTTEDGMREAFKEIAGWHPGPSEELSPQTDLLVPGMSSDIGDRRERRTAFGSQLTRRAATIALALLAMATLVVMARANDFEPAGIDGHWETMAEGPLSPRMVPTTLWTGTELLVWGGSEDLGDPLKDGARYDPASDSWQPMADYPFEVRGIGGPRITGGAPTSGMLGAWIGGSAVFVVPSGPASWDWDLATYNPADDTWQLLGENRFDQAPTDQLVRIGGAAPVDVPYALLVHDDQLIIVGFRSDIVEMGWASVAVDDLSTRPVRWSDFTGFPEGGYPETTPIAGTPLLIGDRIITMEGGLGQDGAGFSVSVVDGDAATIDSPEARSGVNWLSGAMTDDGLLVGEVFTEEGTARRVAYKLDPDSGDWTQKSPPAVAPIGDDIIATPVATPKGYLLLGGLTVSGTSGGLRSETAALSSGTAVRGWKPLPPPPIDLNRLGHTVIWTGEEVIVWGGATTDVGGPINRATVPLDDGARFRLD